MKKLISIIIPIFNEAQNIPVLYQAIRTVIAPLQERYEFELIFINDGSTDKSAELIAHLTQVDRTACGIEFSRNFGKEAATSAGLAQAKGDAAIMIDGDLQHPPELIPEFLACWEKGAEVVVGIRKKNKGEGLVKKIGSYVFYQLMEQIADTKITPNATDFRLLDRMVIEEFNKLSEKNRMTRGLIDWLGFAREYIFFDANVRGAGTAGYNFLKLVRLAFSSVVALSLFPLKLAGYLGIVITCISGPVGVFIFIEKYLLRDSWGLHISGVASLVVLTLFLVGIVLLCLGLIALYIANIHREVINRPMYVVRTIKAQKKIDGFLARG